MIVCRWLLLRWKRLAGRIHGDGKDIGFDHAVSRVSGHGLQDLNRVIAGPAQIVQFGNYIARAKSKLSRLASLGFENRMQI